MVTVFLMRYEIWELDRQPYNTKGRGGFQHLIVTLRQRVDRTTGRLVLDGSLLERIARYAFDYGHGGWESRLQRIFSRSLGPSLGRVSNAA
jgi:hypothetical protein